MIRPLRGRRRLTDSSNYCLFLLSGLWQKKEVFLSEDEDVFDAGGLFEQQAAEGFEG